MSGTYAAGSDPAFEAAVADVLRHEGPFNERPGDPGGPTAWGFDLRDNPDLTIEDLRAMTWDQAKARYWAKWWTQNRWGDLPAIVACKAFDVAVDIGVRPAVACLQRACRAGGRAVAEDGILGVETIGAAGALSTAVVLAALKSELAAHYRLVAQARPAEGAEDLKGWLARAYE